MPGRRETPFEYDIGEAIDQRHVLNRTIRAQVRSVDEDNGVAVLFYENMPSGGKYTTVMPLWMSFPDAKIGSPAWGRFMPQEGDLVRVAFDYDDRPIITGFDISAEKATVADGLSGWPALQEQYTNAKNKGASGPATKAKFAQFTPLKSGEYDFMSSGGAYIYGNNYGRLYLAGGSVSVTLIKNDLRLASRAQLLSHTAEDCELRFGQVRRVNATSQLDEKVTIDTSGVYKEFAVTLKKSVSAGTSTAISNFCLGNIVDDTGSVEGSPNPYRYKHQIFDSTGNESYKMTVDDQGNWSVTSPTTATTGVVFDFSAGTWASKFKKVDVVSSNINLGDANATEHLILGDTYRQEQAQLHQSILSHLTTLAVSLTTIASGLTTAGTGTTAAQIAAALSPTGPAMTNAVSDVTAISTAINTFEGKKTTFLSSGVKAK